LYKYSDKLINEEALAFREKRLVSKPFCATGKIARNKKDKRGKHFG